MKGKEKVEASIDWLQVTFKNLTDIEVMDYILQFPKELMTFENHGRFQYAGCWSFGEIRLYTPPEDYTEMGCHVYITGTGCREMEIYLKAQKRTWFDFLGVCVEFGGNFSRLDIAVDDRNPYFKIESLVKKIEKGECTSKFKKYKFLMGSSIEEEGYSSTLNLGSRQSDCFMVLYEKNYEQHEKTGFPLEYYGDWNRYEVRMRQQVANACVKKLLEEKDICRVGIGVINYCFCVRVKNKEDSNCNRWQIWNPWKRLIEGTEPIKLSQPKIPLTLEQKKQWIAKYVAPTLKMFQMVDDNLGENFLENLIKETELKEEQKKIVDEYLKSRRQKGKEWQSEKKKYEEITALKKQGFADSGIFGNPFETDKKR